MTRIARNKREAISYISYYFGILEQSKYYLVLENGFTAILGEREEKKAYGIYDPDGYQVERIEIDAAEYEQAQNYERV